MCTQQHDTINGSQLSFHSTQKTAMPREARKAPGILKNNHMEHAAKALNNSNVVGSNPGDTVSPGTPKVTPERKFLPYYDPKNSPSRDVDDDSTSYSSYPDMKI